MKRSVNLNGTTSSGRAKASRRALSAANLIATMRKLGMTDEQIKEALLKQQQSAHQGGRGE